ncbi:MAG: glycosyltransferase [Desulfovibrio sp.]|jgi:hypothetical protein|nr:glycosyltransferase [Desulfovibrio sp.]
MEKDAPSSLSPAENRLLVWLGTSFFSSQLPPLGWEVIQRPHEPGLIRSWSHILELTGGRVPAAVLAADSSLPPHLTGMESFPCLTLFYAVDSHIHSWYPLYAQGFDVCLVSLRDHLPDFTRHRLRPDLVWWFPPFARIQDQPPPPEARPEPEWPLLFVGTVNASLHPVRAAFLEEVKNAVPGLHVTRGAFADLYPRALLVLNECSRGDLNFRVFEALGCGACLLTPAVGHGQADLFSDRRDLFLYPPGDAAALAALAGALLRDEPLRARTAQNGLAVVNASHRSSHRARTLSDNLGALLDTGEASRLAAARRKEARALHARFLRPLYLHHAETTSFLSLRQAYLAAAKTVPAETA